MADPEVPKPGTTRLEVVGLADGGTPSHGIATPGYVKRKLAEAHAAGERKARVVGLSWGGGVVVAGIAVSFAVWFRAEASAQEKADKAEAAAVKAADAGSDKKLAPIVTDVALIKQKVDTLADDVADIKQAQQKSTERDEEILRLLRKRTGP